MPRVARTMGTVTLSVSNPKKRKQKKKKAAPITRHRNQELRKSNGRTECSKSLDALPAAYTNKLTKPATYADKKDILPTNVLRSPRIANKKLSRRSLLMQNNWTHGK